MVGCILGVESTAHTFGVAVVSMDGEILSNVKDSYTTESGGMIPLEVRAHHREVADGLFKKALDEAGVLEGEIEAVAFSNAPGLAPCLLEGMDFVKKVAGKLGIPVVCVNHCVAHLEIGEVVGARDPVMLYVSGANTQVIAYEAGKYRVFGETLDLGVGNFIDTIGRAMGLGFPAGPKIEKLASEYLEENKPRMNADERGLENKKKLPEVIKEIGFDFSWSEEKVWKLDYPVEEISIGELEWHFDIPFWFKKNGFYDLRPNEVIENKEKFKEEHERIMKSDLSHPVDIMKNKGRWLILDGLHRLAKAKILGNGKIKVRKISRLEISNIEKKKIETTDYTDFHGRGEIIDASRQLFKTAPKGRLGAPELLELPYSVKGMDVAFAGMQTKIRNLIRDGVDKRWIAYSMQEVVFAMLVEVAERALAHTGKKELLLGGGVACNSRLVEMCREMCSSRNTFPDRFAVGAKNSKNFSVRSLRCESASLSERGDGEVKLFVPPKSLLVDNAGMIGYLGLKMFKAGLGKSVDEVDIAPRERTDEVICDDWR